MDNLKKYLKEHREELDTDTPRDAVWMKIKEASVVKKKIIPAKMIIRYAAAAAVLVIVIFSIKLMNKPSGQIAKHDQPEMQKINPVVQPIDTTKPLLDPVINENEIAVSKENKKHRVDDRYAMLNSLEVSFKEVVQLQVKSIRNTAVHAEDPDYFSGFKTELQITDAEEMSIRNAVKKYGMDDKLLEQLIDVYQHKLNVLKSLRNEINKMNGRASQDSIGNYYLDI